MLVNKLFVWQEIVILICVLFSLGEGQLAVNISTTATLFASPSLEYGKHNYEKDNAIDGDPSTSPDTCDCCYCSANNAKPFFTAYLNVPTYVDLIKVHGRTDKTDSKSNLQYITVYADGVAPTVTFSNNHENAEIKPPSLPITNITIVREKPGTVTGEWYLMICELQIQISVAKCNPGKFGINCSQNCHCMNGGACTKDNGLCPDQSPRCAAGWMGSACDKECTGGMFGPDCNYTSHCINGSGNQHDTGICDVGACDPGWQMTNCSVECNIGSFGDGCTRHCHCVDVKPCNKLNGICQRTGCAAGWKGSSCEIALTTKDCTNGTFGKDCIFQSHCINATESNSQTGLCTLRVCDPGWQMENCSVECNHSKFGMNCSQSCYCNHDEDCANDKGTCPEQTPLCAAGWVGNACDKECTGGMFGYDCNYTSHCVNDSSYQAGTGICDEGRCDPGWQMTNCSVECDHGRFGVNCSSECHCLIDTDCIKDTGFCPDRSPRCGAGWEGESCNIVCHNGTFGSDCMHTSHCINGSKNHPDTGVCEQGACDPGWWMENCSEACEFGKFGMNCSSNCSCASEDCNKVTGSCPDVSPRCAAGWQGETCSLACTNGTFGNDCNYNSHCINGSKNQPDTGLCDKGYCAAGWQGSSCSKECDSKHFGMNCSQQCHCRNDCEHVGGSCLKGLQGEPLCEDDWEGNLCESKKSKQSSSGATTAAAVGSSVAVVVIVVAVIAVFLRRRHLAKRSKAPNTGVQFLEIQNNKPDLPHHSQNVSNQQQEGTLNHGFKGDENAYYSFAPVQSEIKLHQIWHYVRRKQLDECKEFDEEFQKLPYGLVKPFDVSQLPENKGKSRYRVMYAYDHTRVILEITGKEQTDFINATIVHGNGKARTMGYEKHGKFIASQGPTDNMVKDFWRMVWQKNISKIIMLTNCMEAGVQKCIKYWPDKGSVEQYDDVTVHLEQTDEQRDYVRRQMKIQMEDEPDRIVVQFHFKAWPDKDVPDSTWCLVNFWKAVNREYDAEDAPIVVHCSAGIGRTGTYIAIDYLHNQAQLEGVVRPLQAVLALREQRVNMVQTKEQYAFLHEAVADMIGLGTHFIWSSQFEAVYHHLMESDPSSKKTRLATQFELLCASLKDNEYAAQEEENTYANANVAKELDTYRPKSRKRGSKYLQEIDAMFIPSYSGAKTFIFAKSPTEGSLACFWSLVQDENVKTIISLCDTSARNYKTCCELGSGSGSVNDLFVVDTVSTTKQKSHVARSFVFHEHGQTNDDDLTTVKVFDYTAWKSGYVTPGDALSVLELVEAVTAWQPHLSESQPILLHCSTGSKRCGVLCLVLNELHRLKREDGQINILDSLMKMKQRNGNMIENAEQYQFCHDVILMHLRKQDNVYANV